MSKLPVVVVGAGLAGLACARTLADADLPVLVLESESEVGGRVRTREVDGFLLDEGFQVLLTSYPEVRRWVSLEALELGYFRSGARLVGDAGHRVIADPWREPAAAMRMLFDSTATWLDKARVARLRASLVGAQVEALVARPEQTTRERLRALGFSDGFVRAFWQPFLAGVFLDPSLETSSRSFELCFKHFSAGRAALPARGMRALPEALAAPLGGQVRLGARVVGWGPRHVELATGESVAAQAVVLTAPASDTEWHGTSTIYFTSKTSPTGDGRLVLDAAGSGPMNNLAVLSDVAPSYAPPGRHLIAASVLHAAHDPEAPTLVGDAMAQARRWFGEAAAGWEHLATVHVPRALPRRPAGRLAAWPAPAVDAAGVYRAGDALDAVSIDGALASGRRAAEAVLSDRGVMAKRAPRAAER